MPYSSVKDRNAAGKRWFLRNTEYRREWMKRRLEKDPRFRKGIAIKHKYGMTLKDFDSLISEQNNCCAICEISFDIVKPHIDHDHSTGKVRGILCRLCNLGLGKFKDSSFSLIRATQYLLKNGKH